jgi:hypothetical protein
MPLTKGYSKKSVSTLEMKHGNTEQANCKRSS